MSVHFEFKENIPQMSEIRAHTVEEFAIDRKGWKECPKLSIVIMVVGSRGTCGRPNIEFLTLSSALFS